MSAASVLGITPLGRKIASAFSINKERVAPTKAPLFVTRRLFALSLKISTKPHSSRLNWRFCRYNSANPISVNRPQFPFNQNYFQFST